MMRDDYLSVRLTARIEKCGRPAWEAYVEHTGAGSYGYGRTRLGALWSAARILWSVKREYARHRREARDAQRNDTRGAA